MQLLAFTLLTACGPDGKDQGHDSSLSPDDADGDGYAQEDCDDASATVHPGAEEVCDGVDNDCDGTTDVGAADASRFHADGDGDGYGDAAESTEGCDAPIGYVPDGSDCDDADGAVHPGAAEEDCTDPVDYDCDGSSAYVDADGDGSAACEDCDDADAARSPDLPEICDAADIDEDCDGAADDADDAPSDARDWFRDRDADGFGDPASAPVASCEAPDGYASNATDCDDYDSGANPDATEVCDAYDLDEDCDGLAEDGDSSVSVDSWMSFYRDLDGDGYGDATRVVSQCEIPTGYATNAGDCDDADGSANPGAAEVCDAADIDEDCDGSADDDDGGVIGTSSWYLDADADGHGGTSASVAACAQPAGYTADADDCDDADPAVYPGATEVCDAADADEDCDGSADDADASATGQVIWYRDQDRDTHGSAVTRSACDEPVGYVSTFDDCDDYDPDAFVETTWFQDLDADGYGDATSPLDACGEPVGYVSNADDCDDGDDLISPAEAEVCDAADVDEDCDGLSDDLDPPTVRPTWYPDADADGYGTATGSVSACEPPAGHAAVAGDCDDGAPAISPAGTEVCDAADVDEDCDGAGDDADSSATGQSAWYADTDGDGYGDADAPISACDAETGQVADATDCDDASAQAHPGGAERCDAADLDEDCDGLADDDDPSASGQGTWYLDADGDGYGDSGATASGCDTPEGYAAESTDCDDGDAAVSPGEAERCHDEADNDCDGLTDEGCELTGTIAAADFHARLYGDGSAQAGTAVGGGLDFDADGTDDLIIGAGDSSAGYATGGAVYVVTGDVPAGSSAVSTADYAMWYGTSTYSDVGEQVWVLPDLYADGSGEFFTSGKRSTYTVNLVLGPQTAGASGPITSADYQTNTCEVVAWAGSSHGTSAYDWLCGYSVYSTYTGYVRVYDGYTTAAGTLIGEAIYDYAGHALAGGGDVDGDGYDDYFIGAYGDNSNGLDAGAVYVVYAPLAASPSVNLADADEKSGGDDAGDYYGHSLHSPGDIDSDGHSDILVGAYGDDDGGADAGVISLRTYANAFAATFVGANAGDYLGHQDYGFMSTGDVDGDGNLDLLIGTAVSDTAATDAGQAWLFYGPLSGTYDLGSATSYDATFLGDAAGDYFGWEGTLASDLDDDGLMDVAIGAPHADEDTTGNAGAVYIFYGD